jgi:gamma-aminobutyric acid receptor subunit pi
MFLALFSLLLSVQSQNSALPEISQISNELFRSYDKLSRPYYGQKPTEVACQYRINALMEVSPKLNQFTVDLFLRLKWTDPRLKYKYDLGYETLQIDPTLIWKPDIYFHNEAKKMDQLDATLKIKSNGEVFWSRHFIMALNSEFDMHDFPFDSQQLDFVLLSFANNEKTMNLSYYSNGPIYPPVGKTFSAVLWSLDDDFSRHLQKENFREGEAPFDKLIYSIKISRQSSIYVLKFIVPLAIVSLSTCLTYWITPTSIPARTSFSVALLIATITLNFVIQSDLPKVNYPSNLDLYIAMVFMFVFVALVEFAFTHYFLYHGKTIIAEVLDYSFRGWQPVMVIHSLGILFRNGPINNDIKKLMVVSALTFTIWVVVTTVANYRNLVEEAETAAEG